MRSLGVPSYSLRPSSEVMPLAHIARYRNGATIDQYVIYRLSGLKGDPFDQGK